jgi:hypothetical protein
MPHQPELDPADTVRITARELAELARAAKEAGEVEYLTTEEAAPVLVGTSTGPVG